MKILSIDIPEDFQGLREIRMRGLGEVVLLAGPNGGGKSRLLEAVGNFARRKLTDEQIARNSGQIEQNRESIGHYEAQLEVLHSKGVNDHRIADNLKHVAAHQNQIDMIVRANDDSSRTVLDREDVIPVVVDYRVSRLQMKDSHDFKLGELRKTRHQISSDFNVGLSAEYGLAAIHDLILRQVDAVAAQTADQGELTAQVERLKKLIADLLETELGYESEKGPTLFGLPIATAALSKGQTVLLQIAMALFFQDGTKEDLIVLLDEPETHLHPHALIHLVDRIRLACPHAQVWIATHSLHVLAHYDFDSVWFVKDGSAQKAGQKKMDVLLSLVGDDDGLEELSQFLSLPVKSAALTFASECMLSPTVVDTTVGDPQTSQIRDAIWRLMRNEEPLRVLDFGMGKGRLLGELVAAADGSGTTPDKLFDYLGYDPFAADGDADMCRARLVEVYGDADKRYMSSIDDLRRINRGSVDVVVLCNVLHEIAPSEWTQVFGCRGYLIDLLKPEGYILIVEDQLIRHGERAHAFGFLVLTSAELRILFGCDQEDRSFVTLDHPDARFENRLKAHLVPARFVGNVDSTTARMAIAELRANALRSVRRLQGEQYSASAAREFAFWTHQHVNATLALE